MKESSRSDFTAEPEPNKKLTDKKIKSEQNDVSLWSQKTAALVNVSDTRHKKSNEKSEGEYLHKGLIPFPPNCSEARSKAGVRSPGRMTGDYTGGRRSIEENQVSRLLLHALVKVGENERSPF